MPVIYGVSLEALRMFRVLEKDGERRPVYSKGDLDYMARRGWREVAPAVAPAVALAPEPAPEVRQKRKYTRRK